LGTAGAISVIDQNHRNSGGLMRRALFVDAPDHLAGEHVVVIVVPLAGCGSSSG
jgi:hypothetical protein